MKNKMIGYTRAYHYIKTYYLRHFPHPVRPYMEDILQILVDSYEIEGEVTRISANSHSYKLTISNPTPNPSTSLYDDERQRANLEAYLSSEDGMKDVVADIMQLHSWLKSNGFIDKDGVATEKMLSAQSI